MKTFFLLLCVGLCYGQGRPLNIAHRGSSGRLPEHTLPAYQLAVEEGADVIECDMCVTRDLRIICSHESWLSPTTNVEQTFPESLKNNYVIIDTLQNITDFFSVDFTLDELKQLRRRQKVSYRDPNYDDLYPIVSLEEFIEVAQSSNRTVGIHLETKDRTWVNSLEFIREANTTFEDLVLGVLESYGYTSAADPCFLQSFSEESLMYLRPKTQLRLVKLLTAFHNTGQEKLEELAQFVDGVGPDLQVVIRTSDDVIIERTDFVSRAHGLGLEVHTYTVKNEDRHLAWDYGQDPYNQLADLVDQGVDGIFTDFPATLTNYLNTRFDCS